MAARPIPRSAPFLCSRRLLTAPSVVHRVHPVLPLCSRRTFSLLSILSHRPFQFPSPWVYSHIRRLEEEVNLNPHDVSKQLAFFQALADTKLPLAYQLIITRWERMCEFVCPVLCLHVPSLTCSFQDSASPLLRFTPVFQIYLTALVQTNQHASIGPAVRRRDSLLASTHVPNSVSSNPQDASPTTIPSSSPSTAVPSQDSPLSSEQIAQAVMASRPTPLAKLQTSYELGQSNTPIPVTIVEREYRSISVFQHAEINDLARQRLVGS